MKTDDKRFSRGFCDVQIIRRTCKRLLFSRNAINFSPKKTHYPPRKPRKMWAIKRSKARGGLAGMVANRVISQSDEFEVESRKPDAINPTAQSAISPWPTDCSALWAIGWSGQSNFRPRESEENGCQNCQTLGPGAILPFLNGGRQVEIIAPIRSNEARELTRNIFFSQRCHIIN